MADTRRALLFALLVLLPAVAQAAENEPSAYVDSRGVMRWTTSGKEVALFGVNYTAPFAHAFRAHQRLGVPIKNAIDADVYHLARLGLDAYRIHVWDREISDADGNLVANEHLNALDYLLAQLEKRGIKVILTPLQFGNAGYPEPGVPLEGFTSRYGKAGSLENQESWPLQERYLSQFVSDSNTYTGRAYRDDPNILGFEICNEPGHFEYAPTLAYINRMVKAIRDTGSRQPIFYNMSHGIPVAQAYFDANVQGGTFQWYPAGLVAGRELRGNFLPYVDSYPIPFADNPKFQSKAKIVYEFDAADIGRSYIYPAMARSFRTAGMQFAAQFAYDPLHIAAFNTEYQTHYLNLAYAPQKALSMKIAGEAFRRVPLRKSYGSYPLNTQFAGITVSYASDLAELVTADKYFYTNNTSTKPPAPRSLQQIAGYGNSPLISYSGRGAYFLDRLEPGVWRLEVMPDAVWVRDPFEKPSPNKHVVRIAWNEWPMRIDLADLGENYRATGLNDGNSFEGAARGKMLTVRPGVYRLTRAGLATHWEREDRWKNIVVKEFVAPEPSLDKPYVLHKPVAEASAGQSLRISATVAVPASVQKVELVYYPTPPSPLVPRPPAPQRQQPGGANDAGVGRPDTGGAQVVTMSQADGDGFTYSAEIPASALTEPGTVRYHIAVLSSQGYATFPSERAEFPTDWRFAGAPWSTRVVAADSPILLFDAATDAAEITGDHRGARYDVVVSDRPGTSALQAMGTDLATGEHETAWRYFFKDKLRGRTAHLTATSNLVLFAGSATKEPCPVQVALVTSDGIAYGSLINIPEHYDTYSIPLRSLKPVRAPNIPHGYPVFIPLSWSSASTPPLDLEKIESVMVSIGPGIAPESWNVSHGVRIERIWLF
jgi:Cellulase (glycosyl hydrolase family 5)